MKPQQHQFDPYEAAKCVTVDHLIRMKETSDRQVPRFEDEPDLNLWWIFHPAVELVLTPDAPLWHGGKTSELDPKGDSAFTFLGLPGQWVQDESEALGLVVLRTYNFREYPYAIILTYGLEMYVQERAS